MLFCFDMRVLLQLCDCFRQCHYSIFYILFHVIVCTSCCMGAVSYQWPLVGTVGEIVIIAVITSCCLE